MLFIIDHGHGMLTRYGHLDKIIVKRGKPVKRGDKLPRWGIPAEALVPMCITKFI